MSLETFPKLWQLYHVYCVLCRDGDGPLYVKFGHSRRIWNRMLEVKSASPIPAKWFGYVATNGYDNALALERRIHQIFDDRRTSGEWFRFDFESQKDKDVFNEGCRIAFNECLPKCGLWWKKVAVSEIDTAQKWQAMADKNPDAVKCFNKPLTSGAMKRRSAWKQLV